MRHAIVEVPCVNVVICVVLGELHVVRVVPVFLVCDAAVHIHFVLIALHRSHCFHRSHFTWDFAVLDVQCLHLPPRWRSSCSSICGGVAQTCHDDRVVELRVQLGVQEVEGKDREEQVEVERERRLKEVRPWI